MHTSGISMAVSVLEHSHTVLASIWNDEIATWENEYRYLIVIDAIFEKLMNKIVNENVCILQACRNQGLLRIRSAHLCEIICVFNCRHTSEEQKRAESWLQCFLVV